MSMVPRPEGRTSGTASALDTQTAPSVVGADLSLPPEIASALQAALAARRYSLETAQTARNRAENICFHRIIGRSEAGACSAALVYFDQSRLERYNEPWWVYWLCIRIRKAFCKGEQDKIGIVFLAPEGTRYPDDWSQQADDVRDLRIAATVRFERVAPPIAWTGFDDTSSMQEVDQWTTNLGLRPLSDVPDAFGRRGEIPQQQLSPDSAAVGVVPSVFISYAHDDAEWLQQVLNTIRPLTKRMCRVWTDDAIRPASDWNQSIQSNLESAQIVMLLVSESFLASEYVQNIELKRALRAAEEGKKKVLWVHARKLSIMDSRLNRWQAAHNPKTSLDRLPENELKLALDQIYDSLDTVVKEVAAGG
jgi:hypothetical protein